MVRLEWGIRQRCGNLGLSTTPRSNRPDFIAVQQSSSRPDPTRFRNLHTHHVYTRQVKPAVRQAAQAEVEAALRVLDGALQKQTFLAAQQVTVADVAVFCAVHDLLLGAKPAVPVERYPALWRWCLTLLHHPQFAKAVPDAAAAIKSLEAKLPKPAAGGSTKPGAAPKANNGGGKKGAKAGAGAGKAAKAAAAAAGAVAAAVAPLSAPPPAVVLDGPPTSLFSRGRTVIRDILVTKGGPGVGETVTVKGWARTIREGSKGALLFLELNDGSTALSIQAILEQGKTQGFDEAKPSACGGAGASVAVTGTLVKSPAKGQDVELHAASVVVLGKVYGGEDGEVGGKLYPLSKKAHSMEFLRSIAHLRSRTRVMGAVMRVRHAMAYATHKFFNDRGFRYVHTPLITGADSEGAGEQFCVTTLLPEKGPPVLPKAADGSVDYTKDFFGRRTSLTVSGQLNVETYCSGLSDVYTFGPTFRAENSHTTRHLAEFWMIEPEIAFADLATDMALAEDYLKYCVWYALTHNEDDLMLLEKVPGGEAGLRERLRNVLDSPFQRITYTEAIEILERDLKAKKVKFDVKPEWGCDLGSEHERYITEQVYQKPVIVTNYPKEIKAFYMRLDDDGRTVAAMDILVPKIGEIIGGSQREERLDVLTRRCHEMGLEDEAIWWYLDLRKYGSMPHAGFGLGFERLILFTTGIENIRDVRNEFGTLVVCVLCCGLWSWVVVVVVPSNHIRQSPTQQLSSPPLPRPSIPSFDTGYPLPPLPRPRRVLSPSRACLLGLAVCHRRTRA
jgi:asparaginyl-tRNA synthetase